MEEESNKAQEEKKWFKKYFCTVTPFSKYLALTLFAVLPFVGFWVGLETGLNIQRVGEVYKKDSGTLVDISKPEKVLHDQLPNQYRELCEETGGNYVGCPPCPEDADCAMCLEWCVCPSERTFDLEAYRCVDNASNPLDTVSDGSVYSVGDHVDVLARITTWESETGGGTDVFSTIVMHTLDTEEHNVSFRMNGINDEGVACIDPDLQKGDIVRLQGTIKDIVPEIGIIMGCDSSGTSVTKIQGGDTEDEAFWQEYHNVELNISFKYPSSFFQTIQQNKNELVVLRDDEGFGTKIITLYVSPGVSSIPDVPGEWIEVNNAQAYLYYYREGAGYSGVLKIQKKDQLLTLMYDAIDTKQSETEIETNFKSIIETLKIDS